MMHNNWTVQHFDTFFLFTELSLSAPSKGTTVKGLLQVHKLAAE